MFDIIEKVNILKGLDPKANPWNGSPSTPPVALRNTGYLVFLVTQQGGTTGYATLTVEACSDVTPSSTQAIAFKYRKGGNGYTAGTGDVMGAWTDASSAGFATTPAENRIYEIVVEASTLPDGFPFARLKATIGAADAAVAADVKVLLARQRYGGADFPGAYA